jgi:hypothetical protein
MRWATSCGRISSSKNGEVMAARISDPERDLDVGDQSSPMSRRGQAQSIEEGGVGRIELRYHLIDRR